MHVPIIKIGNSRGLRLSKSILDQYQISEQVELIMKEDHIILKPIAKPRQNWGESFESMANSGDDTLLIDDVFSDENPDEWT